ncbi:unnamed protein product, partial [marine sediment metagenome]
AIEVTGLNEWITHPLKDEMAYKGKFLQVIELHARGKKEDRISGLAPYYHRGVVYHNPAVCRPLEEQLLSFPYSRYMDAMDALAYVIELKDLGNRFFLPDEPDDGDQWSDADEDEAAELEESELSWSGIV